MGIYYKCRTVRIAALRKNGVSGDDKRYTFNFQFDWIYKYILGIIKHFKHKCTFIFIVLFSEKGINKNVSRYLFTFDGKLR